MKNIYKTARKIVAVLLCIIAVLPTCIVVASAAFSVDESFLYTDRQLTSIKSYRLTNGVTEGYFTIDNAALSNQIKGYAIEVDLNNSDVTVVAGYNDGDADEWGRATVMNQAAAIENKYGVNVIAGVNGDMYAASSGEPRGILIMNGEVFHNASGHPFFAVLKDGTAVIRNGNGSTDDVKEAIGGDHILITNGVVHSFSDTKTHPRTAVGIKEDGTVVLFVADGRQSPSSCGMVFSDLACTMKALGCYNAMSVDGGGSSTLITERECLSALDVRNVPSYAGVERPVSTSLLVVSSAKATGIFDHVSFSESAYEVHPYHSIQIEMVACDINGFKAEVPNGELVIEDSSYGSFTGSTFWATGKTGTTTLNYVVDGEIVGSTDITVTYDAPNFIEQIVAALVQALLNFKQLIETVFEKLEEKTGVDLAV